MRRAGGPGWAEEFALPAGSNGMGSDGVENGGVVSDGVGGD